MIVTRTLRLAAALLLVAATSAMAGGDEAGLENAQRLMRAEKYGEAAHFLEAMTKAHPDDALAWFELAAARYRLGDHEGAIAAGLTSAQYPDVRGSALYNVACSYGILGNVDAAKEHLGRAISEGFLDFDLMKTDPDLALLRDERLVQFPEPYDHETFTAHNGVEFAYRVELPEGYDASRTYPAFVTFAPGGRTSSDWALAHVWGDESASRGWIGVHLASPARGWHTHPSHHALEDLLDEIKKAHEIEGGAFHLVAFGDACRSAQTYSGMSAKYFQSLTLVGSRSWVRWDDEGIRSMRARNVHLVVGGEDAFAVTQNRRAKELLDDGKRRVHLEIVEGEGHLPRPMFEGGLMRYLADRVHRGGSS